MMKVFEDYKHGFVRLSEICRYKE